jgi:hypothetical protein
VRERGQGGEGAEDLSLNKERSILMMRSTCESRTLAFLPYLVVTLTYPLPHAGEGSQVGLLQAAMPLYLACRSVYRFSIG